MVTHAQDISPNCSVQESWGGIVFSVGHCASFHPTPLTFLCLPMLIHPWFVYFMTRVQFTLLFLCVLFGLQPAMLICSCYVSQVSHDIRSITLQHQCATAGTGLLFYTVVINISFMSQRPVCNPCLGQMIQWWVLRGTSNAMRGRYHTINFAWPPTRTTRPILVLPPHRSLGISSTRKPHGDACLETTCFLCNKNQAWWNRKRNEITRGKRYLRNL